MKIWTSYFYMVRFMQPWMIPVSTALWDPKWYREPSQKNQSLIQTYNETHVGKIYLRNSIYLDKRDVINGLRCDSLKDNSWQIKDRIGDNLSQLIPKFVLNSINENDGNKCSGWDFEHNRCKEQGPEVNPNNCGFMREYAKRVDSINFDKLVNDMDSLYQFVSQFLLHHSLLVADHPLEIVLLFHEAPNNPCSERVVVTKYLKDHGVDVHELTK